MRAYIVMLGGWAALTLADAAAAQADRAIDHPDWVETGDPSKLGELFPAKAKAAGVATGRVLLDCIADRDGRMTGCKAISEDPDAMGFGDAGLRLAATMAIAPKGQDGRSVEGVHVRFAVRINEPNEAAAPAQAESQPIADPLWRTRPNDVEIHSAVPPKAIAKGVNGRVELRCIVQADGSFKNCAVILEDPPEFGFAQAALNLVSKYTVQPVARDGRPTAGRPLQWGVLFISGTVPAAFTVMSPVWAAAPSPGDLEAARMATRSSDIPDRLVFRCKIGPDGGLRDCRSVGPGDAAAALAAARVLLAEFRVQEQQLRERYVEGAAVELTIQWRPAHAPPAPISEPTWERSAGITAYRAAFPAKATALGLTKGQVALDCLVNGQGALTDCHVTAETPVGAGFGDAALSLASDMKIAPWANDGLPSEGRRVSFAVPFQKSFAATLSADAPLRLAPRSRWRTTPSPADYARVLSPQAKAAGKNGLADLQCTAEEDGALSDCAAVWEYPQDEGLGQSALQLSKLIRVGPPPGGAKIAGAVLVPVYFAIGDAAIYQRPEWVVVPSADQFRSWEQLPSDQAAVVGGAVVTCTIGVDGSPKNCHVHSETPSGHGFGAAAMRAVVHTQFSPALKNGEPLPPALLDVPFEFPPRP